MQRRVCERRVLLHRQAVHTEVVLLHRQAVHTEVVLQALTKAFSVPQHGFPVQYQPAATFPCRSVLLFYQRNLILPKLHSLKLLVGKSGL